MLRLHLFKLRVRALLLGDLDACHDLGASWATGDLGRGPDFERAVGWYRRAAERGHPESQYDLGFMVLLGEGVSKSPSEALRWLEMAAEAGYCEAMRLLVDLYRAGISGVAQDEARADQWAEHLASYLEQHPEHRRAHERPE